MKVSKTRRASAVCGQRGPKIETIREKRLMYTVPKAFYSLWATGADTFKDKRERVRTVVGPCAVHRCPAHRTVNASGGPTL